MLFASGRSKISTLRAAPAVLRAGRQRAGEGDRVHSTAGGDLGEIERGQDPGEIRVGAEDQPCRTGSKSQAGHAIKKTTLEQKSVFIRTFLLTHLVKSILIRIKKTILGQNPFLSDYLSGQVRERGGHSAGKSISAQV